MTDMDAPLQRTLKIGRATIGLLGLDSALNRIRNCLGLDLHKAAEQYMPRWQGVGPGHQR